MSCFQTNSVPSWVSHRALGLDLKEFMRAIPNKHKPQDENEFSPSVDVFDTQEAFVLHAALPGAKKEDIAVDFDPESNEIHIFGIIYREGDEKMIQSLVIKGRQVGIFKRKYRLGSQKRPASIDASHITAKLENGILVVVVPKLEKPTILQRKVVIE
ncbi:HSP20-like chaperone [Peziza echinospora]|nr:HSP20-like chaperone [Peziza echinospora]